MKFIIHYAIGHSGPDVSNDTYHGNVIVDTPPSCENLGSLQEAIVSMEKMKRGIEFASEEVAICNVIPLPERIVRTVDAPKILRPV